LTGGPAAASIAAVLAATAVARTPNVVGEDHHISPIDASAAARLRFPGGGGETVPTGQFQYCRARPSLTVAVSPFEPVRLLLVPGAERQNVVVR